MSAPTKPPTAPPTTWKIVQAPDPRPLYVQSPDAARRRRSRQYFRQHVSYDSATGCWLWSGPSYEGRPSMKIRESADQGGTYTRSAFAWMMDQWFPQVKFPDKSRGTVPSCGESLCVSPHHRTGRSYAHLTKLSDRQVKEIYDSQGEKTTDEIMSEYGISHKTVWEIWSGRSRQRATGARRPRPVVRKITAEQAVEIYRRKDSGQKQAAVAEEFGISRYAVSHIWSGRMWGKVTGACLSDSQTA